MKAILKEGIINLTGFVVFLLPWCSMGYYACEWRLGTAYTMAVGVLAYAIGRLLQTASVVWMHGFTPKLRLK